MKRTETYNIERAVLASMMYHETAKITQEICEKVKFEPHKHFQNQEIINIYDVFRSDGIESVGYFVFGEHIKKFATANIKPQLLTLISVYNFHLQYQDRTLDTFLTPPPDDEDPDCLFQNRWLRRGMCGALVSTSGIGKSSISIQMSLFFALGRECLGIKPTRPMKIGIFQSEDDEFDIANFRDNIAIGLREIEGWTDAEIQDAQKNVIFCSLDGSTGDAFIDHLRIKQLEHHFDLIIINPLFAFFGGDLNHGDEMTHFLRHGIDRVIKHPDTRCGCLIIHHTAKPSKDAIAQGDVFKAYIGSGSGEFTNYIRSALVITPYKDVKVGGVFELIGAKHGDKLGWIDADGKRTIKRIVCYANRIELYKDSPMIFWTEPEPDEVAALTIEQTPSNLNRNAPRSASNDFLIQTLAQLIGAHWRADFTPEDALPVEKRRGQRQWAERLSRAELDATRAEKRKAYEEIAAAPYRFGLTWHTPLNAKRYLIAEERNEEI